MLCPNCGENNKKVVKNFTHKTLNIHVFECSHCGKLYAGTKKWFNSVPVPLEMDFPVIYPKRVQKLSPNALKCYSQALTARNVGLDDFAGVGLRMAMENLLWDYLIKFKNLPQNQIARCNLKQLAEKMKELNENTYASICNEVIRTYGNEAVHVRKSFPPISLKDSFWAYEKLCEFIDSELYLLEIESSLDNHRQARAK